MNSEELHKEEQSPRWELAWGVRNNKGTQYTVEGLTVGRAHRP